jgi:hypothetical protein
MARGTRRIIRVLILAGGCCLLVLLFARFGPARILSLLASLKWNFLVILLVFTGHELVRALAVRCWLPADHRPPIGALLRIRLIGEAAGALTRTGALTAEPARAWLLARSGGGQAVRGYSAAAGELLANTGMSAAVNVVVTGYLLLAGRLEGPVTILAHVLFWASLVLVVALVAVVVSGVRVLGVCARFVGGLPLIGRRLQADPARIAEAQRAISSAFTERPAVLAQIFLFELSAQALLVLEVYWAIRSLGVAISGATALVIEVMTRAFSVIELVGATEMGFAFAFAWLGLPAAIGFTLSLIKTLRSVAAAAVGIPVLTFVSPSGAALAAPDPRPAALEPDPRASESSIT